MNNYKNNNSHYTKPRVRIWQRVDAVELITGSFYVRVLEYNAETAEITSERNFNLTYPSTIETPDFLTFKDWALNGLQDQIQISERARWVVNFLSRTPRENKN